MDLAAFVYCPTPDWRKQVDHKITADDKLGRGKFTI